MITADTINSAEIQPNCIPTSDVVIWALDINTQRRVTIDELITGPHAGTYKSLRDSLNIQNPRQLIWHVINGVLHVPVCACGQYCNWAKTQQQYRLTCSNKCAAQARAELNPQTANTRPETPHGPWQKDPSKLARALKRRRENSLAKYNVEHHSQRPEVREKTRKTNLDRYGVEHVAQSADVAGKISQSFKKKFKTGTTEHEDLIARRRSTSLDRYGVDHAMQNPNIKQKHLNTMTERHGVEHALQSEVFNKKRKSTNITRYGVSEAAASDIVKNTAVEENRKKYNCDNHSQVHFSDHTKLVLFDPVIFEKELSGKTLDQSCEYLGVSLRTILNYAKTHDLRNVFSDVKTTKIENKIQTLLESLTTLHGYQKNTRKIIPPSELDFFIPGENLAIEVHGLYWHCEHGGNHRSKSYHMNKWKQCQDNNITLLQFTNLDIENNFHLVESKIKRHLGHAVPVVGARRLKLYVLQDFSQEQEFLKTWHLQGPTSNRNFTIAAEYQDQLVGISTWKYHQNSAELVRFATNVNYSYPGLLSRMINMFVRHTGFSGQILSYSNNMYGTGKAYLACGFQWSGTTPPGYFYTKNYTQLESRLQYQKHKLAKIFDLDQSILNSQSEWQIMQTRGYDRFWDAGHSRWKKTISPNI